MTSYASLCHVMSVYVNLCQFMSYYVSSCQFMPVCFTSSHLYQLMSIDVSLLLPVSLSVSSAPLFLSALPHLNKHSCPSSFLLLIATQQCTQSGLSIILILQVLFSVCCFVTTVMLVPLDHNIFCVSVYQITIKNTKHISINKVVRCVQFHVLESCQCTH